MKLKIILCAFITGLFISACGGGGGSTSSLAQPSSIGSISGTVPGTIIEAFGDNGSYYRVESTNDGSAQHPFDLELPSGIGFRLVMTTNEGTPDQVVSPIGFRDSSGEVQTRFVLGPGDEVELGHIPLHLSLNEAAGSDADGDGVLDEPLILDDVAANNPLLQLDADGDGVDDWNDPDHGGYEYPDDVIDPIDQDDDGIPNTYDADYKPAADFIDDDRDGLHDAHDDANPLNAEGLNSTLEDDMDGDGYHDDDLDHDGFHDDDLDRDGFQDGDLDHDGLSDSEDDDSGDDDGANDSGEDGVDDSGDDDGADGSGDDSIDDSGTDGTDNLEVAAADATSNSENDDGADDSGDNDGIDGDDSGDDGADDSGGDDAADDSGDDGADDSGGDV